MDISYPFYPSLPAGISIFEMQNEMLGCSKLVSFKVRVIYISGFFVKVAKGDFIFYSFIIDQCVFSVDIICKRDFIIRFSGFLLS